jgi:3-hydroxybutyryl-CoA dehydrogenase
MVLFVRRVGVVGAGVMGQQIAELLAFNGKQVVLKDVSQEVLDRAMKAIEQILTDLVDFHRGRAEREIRRLETELGLTLDEEDKRRIRERLKPTFDDNRKAEALERITPTLEWGPFHDVDLVIEAVYEDVSVKKQVFRELDRYTPKHAVLATNTSSLSITEIASATERRDRVIGIHFFNPVHTLPLVEVIPGLDTRSDVVDDVIDFISTLRNHRYPMQPIRVREVPGFVVNRVLGAMLLEAFGLYEEGVASYRDIDLAMKSGAGMPIGPFELADLIGIDVLYHVAENLRAQWGMPAGRGINLLRRMYHAGRWGRKTGRGFYEYGG